MKGTGQEDAVRRGARAIGQQVLPVSRGAAELRFAVGGGDGGAVTVVADRCGALKREAG